MSIFWQMQAKNLSSFPWKNLLDWYAENGRHDLPWREYEGGSVKSEVGSDDENSEMGVRGNSPFDKGDVTEGQGDLGLPPGEGGMSERQGGSVSEKSEQNPPVSPLNRGVEQSIIYRVWLSEILLQQTQASRVVGFFNRMLERFPTIESLAKTDYETFFPYYQGLGYYSRARNILRTAKIVHEQYGGVFPKERELLIKLPGVGPYTAEAIRAFGYGIPTLSWDTNLEKVFARYYHGTKTERLSKEEKELVQEDLERFIRESRIQNPESGWGKWGNRDSGNSPLSKGDVTQGQGDLGLPPGEGGMPERQGGSVSETTEQNPPVSPLARGVEQTLVRSINNALMDFAAMVDLANPTNINWADYPIQSGRFYETRGSLEPEETRKSATFPTPDATIIVTLHENHRIYFSSKKEQYEPFALPPALTRDTREYVKSYFREKYNLELSVRPPHRKWLSEDGRPYIAVNAQVQVGEVKFQKWNKKGERLL